MLNWLKRKNEKIEELSPEIKLLLQNAENGDPDAQYALGLLYLEGQGVKKDEKTAAEWFQKATDQGHKEAQKKLSWCYLYGKGVKQSLTEALKLSQEADGTNEKVDMNKFGALIRK